MDRHRGQADCTQEVGELVDKFHMPAVHLIVEWSYNACGGEAVSCHSRNLASERMMGMWTGSSWQKLPSIPGISPKSRIIIFVYIGPSLLVSSPNPRSELFESLSDIVSL